MSGAAERDGGVRGRPGPIYRAASNLGVRARVWNLAEICGRGSRPGVAQARKTDLARRARAVSESGVGRAGRPLCGREVLTSWAQVAASSGERRREAVL